ncbi:DegT/DnrJ/EryC1/StrS family aminotransferase [Legionella brunensis]|uniref:DegT/DnrJ/EryC1/StrS aminotransferase family protein n=1 Tax=Legionella brunensis TaxID=29422 RepID=A0A0W0SF53_9GAMM|nr:DegT/DnrJ/EryC1/StrS family aminotransferase [Legionella brunensis]KTC81525.1 DegT/DnrJ/EryC1/StrS aminotransferase family protein [Legionella brunensis]
MKSNLVSSDKLVLYGGQPTRQKPWPTYDKGNVILDDEDASSLEEVLRSKKLFRYDNRKLEETKVGQFENQLKDFFHIDYALAVSSGTAALSLPLMALGLPENS